MLASVVVIEPPAAIVTLPEAKWQCRVEHADEDAFIESLMAAAQASIEPPSWLGRAFGIQTLEMRLARFDDFCRSEIPIRFPPLRSIVSVVYDDDAGVEQTLDPAVYRLIGEGGSDVARLALAYGAAWPSIRSQSEAVRIRFEAGYESADPLLLPAKRAVLLMVGDLYAFRETAVTGTIAAAVPSALTVDRLLQGYRVYL